MRTNGVRLGGMESGVKLGSLWGWALGSDGVRWGKDRGTRLGALWGQMEEFGVFMGMDGRTAGIPEPAAPQVG